MHIKAINRGKHTKESIFVFEFINKEDIDGFNACLQSIIENLPPKYSVDADNLSNALTKVNENLTTNHCTEGVYRTSYLYDRDFASFTEALLFIAVHNNNIKREMLSMLEFYGEVCR